MTAATQSLPASQGHTRSLGFMLLFCAAAATLGRQHIALRPVESQRDDRAATLAQLIANSLLTACAWLYRQQELAQADAGIPLAHLFMHDIWVAGFGALTLISLWQLRHLHSRCRSDAVS